MEGPPSKPAITWQTARCSTLVLRSFCSERAPPPLLLTPFTHPALPPHHAPHPPNKQYGANPQRYAEVSHVNYRMGSVATNAMDRRIDNAFHREVFGVGQHGGRVAGGYDAAALASQGIDRQRQLDGIGARFDAAKQMYQAGGGHQFKMMMQDYRDVARTHLGGDMRQFRI